MILKFYLSEICGFFGRTTFFDIKAPEDWRGGTWQRFSWTLMVCKK